MGNKVIAPMMTEWEQAVEDGQAFELSAVANGAYQIPINTKFALFMSGTDVKTVMKGYAIFGDHAPFDVTFYEDAVITGGTNIPMTAINHNRYDKNYASRLTLGMNIGLTAISGTALTPIAAYANSTTSFALQNTDGVSEKWNLAPNKIYAVYGYNKSGVATNLTAMMRWIEK
jgi:hypothetical protein